MALVGLVLLVLVVNGLVLFAIVNLGISFWRRWTNGTPPRSAALDTLLARESRRRP